MHKQKGLTAISWVVILGFLAFQMVLGMNILPVYITDGSVKSIIAGLPSDNSVKGNTPKQLRQLILKRFRINNVYSLKKEHIRIKRSKGFLEVTVEYEPREKLVGNLDFIITFKHTAKVPLR